MAWLKVCKKEDIPEGGVKSVDVKGRMVALFNRNGELFAVQNQCIHKGGPLCDGKVSTRYGGDYIVCPWHGWEFDIRTGKAPPGYPEALAKYAVLVKDGDVFVDPVPATSVVPLTHEYDHVRKLRVLTDEAVDKVSRGLNILGISCTNMAEAHDLQRTSTSELALQKAMEHAVKAHTKEGGPTVLVRTLKLRELKFRACEGYYSKAGAACTWPCAITEMDEKDEMKQVYEGLLWADVVLIASSIRWGNASSLYYKMCERLNSMQNQVKFGRGTIIKNKVAAFIITGGQDNVQKVAGEMLMFFGELGFVFGQYPFVGWTRGWYAEDTENNARAAKESEQFEGDLFVMIDSAIRTSKVIRGLEQPPLHP